MGQPTRCLLLTVLQVCVAQQVNVTVPGRILAIGSATACSTTSGQADHLVEPVDVVAQPTGEVLILDKACSRVTQAPTVGTADGGPVVAGGTVGSFVNALMNPEAMAYDDAAGEIYIADTSNHRVMRWQVGGAAGTAVVTNGPDTLRGKLNKPTGVALADASSDAPRLYVAEGNLRVQYFDLATCCGNPLEAVGDVVMGCVPEDLPCFLASSYAVDALKADPGKVAVRDEFLYIVDTENHRILRLALNATSNGTSFGLPEVVAGTTGIAGCRPEQLRLPEAVAFDSEGFLYVADTGNHRVQKFAVFQEPRALTVAGECCCRTVDGSGLPVGGNELHQLNGPRGIAIDPTGALLVADTGNQRVIAFGGSGYEKFSSSASSCAFGVACQIRLFGAVRSFNKSQVVLVRKDPFSSQSPCGSKNCSFAHWPGITNPQQVGGSLLDTFDLGMAHGPPNNSFSGIGDHAICWAEAPSTACVGYPCSEDDSCSNSTAWLCNGAQPLGLMRKVWYNIQGKTVDDLRNAPAFPNSPDLQEFVSAFSSPSNFGDLFGQLFYGLFLAPETGDYIFQITSNENSELRISKEFNDTVGEVVAYISEAEVWYEGGFPRTGFAPGPDSWDTFPSQSGHYFMEAGHLYYMEALHKERALADHFLVGVILPSGQTLRPIPGSYFDPVICTKGYPAGLAVVHDCTNIQTGQHCTAKCQGGYSGAEQTFICDGVGVFRGSDPVCTAVQCEEYNQQIGSLFMHGLWDQVNCSNMDGAECDAQLRSWAGLENCAFQTKTAGSSCREYCAARGRSCVKSTVEITACCAKVPGEVTTTPIEGSCDDTAAEQICVCGRVEQSASGGRSVCLLESYCSLGLMTAGENFWGAHNDEGGDLIVVDSIRSVVVRWVGLQYTVLAGGHGAGNALNQLNRPLGAYYVPGSPGLLYVADTVNHRVVSWQEGAATGSLVFGTGTSGGSLTEMRYPAGVYFNESLYVVDFGNHRVLEVNAGVAQVLSEQQVRQLALIPGTAGDSFFDDMGNFYRADYGNHRLTVCFRSIRCSWNCRDVDPAATYGASCGCLEDRSNCREAMGALWP